MLGTIALLSSCPDKDQLGSIIREVNESGGEVTDYGEHLKMLDESVHVLPVLVQILGIPSVNTMKVW